MAKNRKVPNGQFPCSLIVAGYERSIQILKKSFHEHNRKPLSHQTVIPGTIGSCVSMLPGDEYDPGNSAIEQHTHILILANAITILYAQHRSISKTCKIRGNDLSENRIHRILQTRQYQSDQPGTTRSQSARPFQTQYIDGRKHGPAHLRAHSRPFIKYTGYRRLTYRRLLGNLVQMRSHAFIMQPLKLYCK
ncbi:hypothetical protein BMYO_1859 [Bifidobacterium myosotis]|uniref:Uncharacterized protein n=1 Tax=Bifidobacterium myosotis TaxID=1630166 RepID=A0A261FED4_9BIFI|nr:hypothetical protein BMYO_1859 [Bifidobacterium myosotis]